MTLELVGDKFDYAVRNDVMTIEVLGYPADDTAVDLWRYGERIISAFSATWLETKSDCKRVLFYNRS